MKKTIKLKTIPLTLIILTITLLIIFLYYQIQTTKDIGIVFTSIAFLGLGLILLMFLMLITGIFLITKFVKKKK